MEKETKVLLPRLAQIGIVVRDLERSMQQYKLLLGAEPVRVIERSPTGDGKKIYRGRESDFFQKVALYQFGDLELELLEPFGGRSVLKDYLDAHGEGIHHIGFDTGDFDGVTQHFAAHGAQLLQTGPTSRHPALRWGFFDTEKLLGTTIEAFNFLEIAQLEKKEEQEHGGSCND